MKSLRRALAMARKELLQLRRDRLTFGMIVGIPLIQILLFGYAINTDVRHLRAAVADQANTQLSHRLIADVQATQVVDVVAQVATAADLVAMLGQGEITVGIFIPRNFDQRVEHGLQAPAQLLVDAADPIILGAAQGLAGLPVATRDLAHAPRPKISTFEVRPYYNPERRSAVHSVPGLIGTILTATMVLFTALAIVRERERGNLEFLITTPVRTIELMAGKVAPYILIGLLQTTLILGVGVALFQVPVRGSLLDLYGGATVFVAASLTLGLVISTLAKTQFQAMQMTVFVFLPSILLSGFMFPFDGMPRFAQVIGQMLPLTHFLRIVRGVLLRGATLIELRDEVYALLAFTAVTSVIAMLRFRKRLD